MQYEITYTVEDTIHIVSMQYHAQCLFFKKQWVNFAIK